MLLPFYLFSIVIFVRIVRSSEWRRTDMNVRRSFGGALACRLAGGGAAGGAGRGAGRDGLRGGEPEERARRRRRRLRRPRPARRRRSPTRRARRWPSRSRQGAPADVFISADLDWMDYLAETQADQAGHRSEPARQRASCWSRRPTSTRRRSRSRQGFDLAGRSATASSRWPTSTRCRPASTARRR